MFSDAGPLQTLVHRFFCPLPSVDREHWERWKSGAIENGLSFDLLLFLFVTHPSASKDIPGNSSIMPLRSEPPFCWALPLSSHVLSCFVQFYVTPMDCSPPVSSVHGILQARILEWIAMPSSRASSWCRDWTRVSYVSCIDRGVFTTSTTWKSPSSYVLVLTFFHFVATPLRVVPAFVLLCLNIPFLLLHLFSTYVIDFLHWIPSVKIDSVHLPSLFNLSCFSFLRFKMEMMMMMIMMIIILSSLGCWWPLSSRSLD